jgi:hypothetical protein
LTVSRKLENESWKMKVLHSKDDTVKKRRVTGTELEKRMWEREGVGSREEIVGPDEDGDFAVGELQTPL